MYPIFLDVRGVPILVVGGGPIAERKTLDVLAAGARVTLVSPKVTDALRELAESGVIRWHECPFDAEDAQGFRLIFAATDDRQVNHRVAREARDRGVWVNVADSLEGSTFLVPSSVRRGSLTIASSTGGKSPLLARRIREELENRYGEEYALLLDLLADAREAAENALPTQPARQRFYEAILDSDVLALLREGRADAARSLVETLLISHAHRHESD